MEEEVPSSSSTMPVDRRRQWRFTPCDFGRKDGIKFSLWLPKDEEFPPLHYIPPPQHSLLNFNSENVSSDWSKEEVFHLFELFSKFEGCFPVMADRWPSTLPNRTALELKEKYALLTLSLDQFSAMDFTKEREMLHSMNTIFLRGNSNPLARKKLEDEVAELKQLIISHVPPPAPHQQPPLCYAKAFAYTEEEETSSKDCWMRSNLLDPRAFAGVTVSSEMMLRMYECFQLLQVPMNPMPTLAVCDTHAELKQKAIVLFALKRECAKLRALAATPTIVVDEDFPPKHTISVAEVASTANSKRPRIGA